MQYIRNKILEGSENRPFLLDLYIPSKTNQWIVLFVHGFKGFKDWGCWEMVAEDFANKGFCYAKFNFSHNGTTINAPLDFEDLDAFGNNNYSHELYDLEKVFNYLFESELLNKHMGPTKKLCLIGHSRGGGISFVKASLDSRVDAIIGWASVPSLKYAWPDKNFIQQWKLEGVYNIFNSRTNQKMPLYYQFFEDYMAHEEEYDFEKNLPLLTIPVAVMHGSEDPAVPVQAAHTLHNLCKGSTVEIIEGADHVFGASHPYSGPELPTHLKKLVVLSQNFLLNR